MNFLRLFLIDQIISRLGHFQFFFLFFKLTQFQTREIFEFLLVGVEKLSREIETEVFKFEIEIQHTQISFVHLNSLLRAGTQYNGHLHFHYFTFNLNNCDCHHLKILFFFVDSREQKYKKNIKLPLFQLAILWNLLTEGEREKGTQN